MKALCSQLACAFLSVLLITSVGGCLSAKRMDKYVADQYNDELPQPNKKAKADILVTAPLAATSKSISTSLAKTDNFLPLIIYWKYKHRITCTLNPVIPVTGFTNAVNTLSSRALAKKLDGKKLELTVEQIPVAFSVVANEQMVVPVYPITWTKVYVEPDFKDLIVSYKATSTDGTMKTGTITEKNPDRKKGFNFLQSWKSATSEYLSSYDATLNAMTKSFVDDLAKEL